MLADAVTHSGRKIESSHRKPSLVKEIAQLTIAAAIARIRITNVHQSVQPTQPRVACENFHDFLHSHREYPFPCSPQYTLKAIEVRRVQHEHIVNIFFHFHLNSIYIPSSLVFKRIFWFSLFYISFCVLICATISYIAMFLIPLQSRAPFCVVCFATPSFQARLQSKARVAVHESSFQWRSSAD